MWRPESNPTAQCVSFLLYSLALFHLPAGRIVYSFGSWGDIRIGSSLENLLPMLLVARFLWRGMGWQGWRERLAPVREPLFLMLASLVVSCAASLSYDSVKELAKILGQAGCGFLLGEWIWVSSRDKQNWCIGFFLGMAWLGWRTPWGDLGIPSLEGPFGHRNTQSAFILLSFPILYLVFKRQSEREWPKALASIAFVVGLAFILVSRSRAGVVGVFTTAVILAYFSFLKSKVPAKNALAIGLATVFAAVALIFLFPRFRDLAQEIGNPYHRSRTAIWAAAVQEWSDPSAFVVGSGLGEAFDRILIDSPTGNLNFRYRRTLHTHCLYLQWILWGGVVGLCGWFLLLGKVWRIARHARSDRLIAILGASLLGYAALEVFESVFRFSRVSGVFFLDLGLLLMVIVDLKGEDCIDTRDGEPS